MAVAFRNKTLTTGTAGSLTGSEPASTAQDDIIWAWLITTATAGTITANGVWNQVATINGTNTQCRLYWTKRGASAPSFLFSWTGGANWAELSLSSYSGCNLVGNPYNVLQANGTSQRTPPNPLCPAVTTTVANTVVLLFGMGWTGCTSAYGAPSGYTIREPDSAGNDLCYAEKSLAGAGLETPGAFTGSAAGTNDVGEVTVALMAPQAGAAVGIKSGRAKYPKVSPGKSPQATINSPRPRISGTYPLTAAPITGTWASTQQADTAAITGNVKVSGTWASTQQQDTAAITGNVKVSGTWASTQQPDSAAITGNAKVSGTWASTQQQDIAALTGTAKASGVWASTQQQDNAALTGTVKDNGTWASTQQQDIASLTGNVKVSGTIGTTQAPDNAAINGTVGAAGITGTIASTQQPDIAALTGSIRVSAALSTTQPPDTAAITGNVKASGVWTSTQARDNAAITGTVVVPVTGTWASIQQQDNAIFVGTAGTGAVAGDPSEHHYGHGHGGRRHKRLEILYIGNEVYAIPMEDVPELKERLAKAKKLYRDNKKRYAPVTVFGVPPEGEDFTVKVAISFDFGVWLAQFRANATDIELEQRLRADSLVKIEQETRLRRRKLIMTLLTGPDV